MPYSQKVWAPGKFEGNRSQWVVELLHSASLDGCDEVAGDVQSTGWYGLLVASVTVLS